MLKQSLILIALSLVIILAMPYAQQATQYLLNAHEWISQMLTDVFSGGQVGNFIRGLLALLSIPFLLSLGIAAIYFAIRRHWMPYFIHIVWATWLIQIGALLATYKV